MSLKISQFTCASIIPGTDFIPFIRYVPASSCFDNVNYIVPLNVLESSFAISSSYAPSNFTLIIGDPYSNSSSFRCFNGNVLSASGQKNDTLFGMNNLICDSGNNNSILGGCTNQIYGFANTIGGGVINYTSGSYSVVAGGINNYVYGIASVIGGGGNNCICGGSSIIASGNGNYVSSSYSTIVGGCGSTNYGYFGFIGTGNTNNIDSTGFSSVIVGGAANSVKGIYNSILNGYSGSISDSGSCFNVIGGGSGNQIIRGSAPSNIGNIIGTGINNTIECTNYSVIGTGQGNTINGSVTTGSYNGILGGFNNNIVNSTNTFVVGSNITATNSSNFTYFNNICVQGTACGSSFGLNIYCGSGNTNVVVLDIGAGSTVRSGSGNCAAGSYSAAVGGSNNKANSDFSAILGGQCNTITGTSTNSAIGAGFCNFIVNSSTSGILAGNNNMISGRTNSFIVGNNISASVDNTTFVNNLSSSGIITSPSFVGTASWASNAVSSSTVTSASYACNSTCAAHATLAAGLDSSTYNTMCIKPLGISTLIIYGVGHCYVSPLFHCLPSAGTYLFDGMIYYNKCCSNSDLVLSYNPFNTCNNNITDGNFYLSAYDTDSSGTPSNFGFGVNPSSRCNHNVLYTDIAGVTVNLNSSANSNASAVLRGTVIISAPTTMSLGFNTNQCCYTLYPSSYLGFQKIA